MTAIADARSPSPIARTRTALIDIHSDCSRLVCPKLQAPEGFPCAKKIKLSTASKGIHR